MFTYTKEILGVISIILAISGYIQYIKTTIKGQTTPHIFTWLIWTVLTGIAYFGQISDNAGSGSWATGVTALVSAIITVLAFYKAKEITITTSDWVAFIFSILSIPVWILTKTPLFSIIIITVIDIVSFYPTIRKTWFHPEQENMYCFTVSGFKFIVALIALDNFTFITSFYIAVLAVANLGFVVFTMLRRRMLLELRG